MSKCLQLAAHGLSQDGPVQSLLFSMAAVAVVAVDGERRLALLDRVVRVVVEEHITRRFTGHLTLQPLSL